MKIEYIFAAFALLAILDKITGNRFKLGDELEKGISTMGALLLTMAGMIVLSPPLAQGFSALFSPALSAIGMDPSVLSALFANDAGGAVIGKELATDALLGAYNGMVVASMFGVTLCMLPLILKLTDKEQQSDVLLGLLSGLATIPVGCIVGGLMMGISPLAVLWNTAPITLLSLLICLGLTVALSSLALVLSPRRVRVPAPVVAIPNTAEGTGELTTANTADTADTAATADATISESAPKPTPSIVGTFYTHLMGTGLTNPGGRDRQRILSELKAGDVAVCRTVVQAAPGETETVGVFTVRGEQVGFIDLAVLRTVREKYPDHRIGVTIERVSGGFGRPYTCAVRVGVYGA